MACVQSMKNLQRWQILLNIKIQTSENTSKNFSPSLKLSFFYLYRLMTAFFENLNLDIEEDFFGNYYFKKFGENANQT